jgi:hypothetical protein
MRYFHSLKKLEDKGKALGAPLTNGLLKAGQSERVLPEPAHSMGVILLSKSLVCLASVNSVVINRTRWMARKNKTLA